MSLSSAKAIRPGQIYRHKKVLGVQLLVYGKQRGKWLCKVLTNKPGVFNGSHRMHEYTLKQKYELVV